MSSAKLRRHSCKHLHKDRFAMQVCKLKLPRSSPQIRTLEVEIRNVQFKIRMRDSGSKMGGEA